MEKDKLVVFHTVHRTVIKRTWELFSVVLLFGTSLVKYVLSNLKWSCLESHALLGFGETSGAPVLFQ